MLFTNFAKNRNVRRVDGNYVIVGFGDSVDFATSVSTVVVGRWPLRVVPWSSIIATAIKAAVPIMATKSSEEWPRSVFVVDSNAFIFRRSITVLKLVPCMCRNDESYTSL